MSSDAPTRKILLTLGDAACGKTCLLKVFSENEFPSVDEPTAFENYMTDIEVDKQKVALTLRDAAGVEDYDRLRRLSYPDTDVVVICYSIASPLSFDNVRDKWIREVRRHFGSEVPIVLVGNKKDLRDRETIENLAKWKQEPITKKQGKSLARKIGALAFYECSAKNREGVKEIFETATRAAMKERTKSSKEEKKTSRKCL